MGNVLIDTQRVRCLIRCLFVAVVLAAGPAPAAVIEVNSTLDAVGLDGRCTLREAISNANADQALIVGSGECAAGSGADLVSLPAGTYAIARAGANEDLNATGDFDLRSSITLAGVAPGTTRISGALLDRVLHIGGSGNVVSLRQLTVSLGLLPTGPANVERGGGGLLIGANNNATLDRVVVEFNSGGSATTNAEFGGGNGGGISCGSNVNLTLVDSIVRMNTAGDAVAGVGLAGRGGGIHGATCRMVIERSRVENNISGDGAGSIAPGPGGGISLFFFASLELIDSVVADNATGTGGTAEGGGVYAIGSQLLATSSSFVRNRATRGGAIAGARFRPSGPLVVRLSNTTLSENTAETGGALYLSDGWDVTLLASTLAENSAPSGGAVALGMCDDLFCTLRFGSSVFLRNTGGDCVLNGNSAVSRGFNAFGASGTCGTPAAGDRVVSVDALGPRVDDYARTPVHVPLAGSALIDSGSCRVAEVTVDQAGESRPQQYPAIDADDGCDIGAIEVRNPVVFADGFE
jgi:CSLREA domain-containing protein